MALGIDRESVDAHLAAGTTTMLALLTGLATQNPDAARLVSQMVEQGKDVGPVILGFVGGEDVVEC